MKSFIALFLIVLTSCNLRLLEDNKSDLTEIVKILLASYEKIKKEFKKNLNETKSEEILKSFKVLTDYKQSLNMKMHQGIHPQYYGKMVERLVERMGTNKEIRNKFAEKLKEIEKEENGKWVHERILFSKDSEKKEKNSNVTYAAYLNLFGKKDVKSGKITLIYTTVSTTFKMKKMLFVHKKDEDTIERRDIDMKPDEIDENDVKVIMGYGDLISLKFFKTYFNIDIPIKE